MSKIKTQQEKKFPTSLNSLYKQNSSSFLLKCYGEKRQNSPRFKKSCKIKPNLHQIKIQADSFCDEKIGDDTNQSRILNELKQKDYEGSNFDKIRIKKSKSFKRQLQIKSESKKVLNGQVRENFHILFKQGFLPDVKKFYSTYKNFDREQERENFLRNTLSCKNDEQNGSFRNIKFASHIVEQNIAPRKLGIVGRLSQEKVNQSSAYLTQKQYRTVAKGISLINVRKIELKNIKLSKQNAKLLIQNLPPKIQKINLKNSISSNSILQQLNSQALKQGRLKKLNLSFNKITDIGLHCIQEVLSQNLTLEVVNLSNNLISDKSAQIIGNFITQNEDLRNLNLSWNQLTGKEMHKIFSAIESSKSLMNVNLSRNTIGKKLAQILTQSQKILPKSKLQNRNPVPRNNSSLKFLCSLLKNNKYLLHFDMSYNKIQSNDCEEIAISYNLSNQTLIGFHFRGNSNYYSNEFGFLVKDQKNKQEIESCGNTYLECKKSVVIKNNDLFKEKKSPDCLDKCWLCLGWITKQFTLQIDKKLILTLQALKKPFSTQKKQRNELKDVYIHIECFDFQPVLMRCKAKIKNGINDKILKSRNEVSVKNLKNQPTLTLSNLKNSPKNQTSLINNDEQEDKIYCYSINLKIPPNRRFRYFFTIDGQPFMDLKGQISGINESDIHAQFDVFNPFRDIWFNKMQKFKEESSILNDQINRAINLFQSLIGVKKESKSIVPHLKVFLAEFNILPCDQQSKQDKNNNEKNKLQEICRKILSDNEQVTKQEFNLLIEQRVKLEEIRNQISEKYISSQRLIQEKQLMFYEDQNEESTFFVKPRFKDMFVRGINLKTDGEFDFCKIFRTFLQLLDDPNNQNASQNLSEMLPKWEKFQKQSESSIFYPLQPEKDTSIDFLNMFHYERLIHQGKVEIKPFTEKILKICNFNKEKNLNTITFGSYKSKQNGLLVDESLKIHLSKILPYALISYHNLKYQKQRQIQSKNHQEVSRMFSKTESRFKKSSRSKSKTKRNRSAGSKERNSEIKNDSAVKTPSQSHQNTDHSDQSAADILTANEIQSQISVQHSTSPKIFHQLNRKRKIDLISIDRVEEILCYQSIETNPNQVSIFDEFVLKLKNWKNNYIRLNDEEIKIITLFSRKIRLWMEKKIQNVQENRQQSNIQSSNFNLEIYKDYSKLNHVIPPQSSTIGINQSLGYLNYQLDGLKKQGQNTASKIISMEYQTGSINILQQTQQFLLYNENFQKCFLNQTSDYSVVDFYVRKINKFLSKKQRQESKLKNISSQKNKEKYKKTISKKSIQKSLQKQQKQKTTLKHKKREKIEQEQVKQRDNQLKTQKNIFIFLQKQKQHSEKYFSNQENFAFIQNRGNQVRMKQHLLTRFDYIILNLVHNLGQVKKLQSTLPNTSKEILLKQLLIFRSLLMNNREIASSKYLQRLAEIEKDAKFNTQSLSLQFIQKVQKVNFIGVIDLLYEHLLYIIYAVTKITCYFILSDPNMLKTFTQKRSNLSKNAHPSKKIKQIIQNDQRQEEKITLLRFIKEHPKMFNLQLEKLMKSVLSDVLLIITKLHNHYDLEIKKEGTQNMKTSKLTETNQSQSKDFPQIIYHPKVPRKSSFFSKTSQKTISKGKKTVSEKKKKLIKQIKKVSDKNEQNGVLEGAKQILLSNISEKKPKLQRKRPKLSLNLPKQTN